MKDKAGKLQIENDWFKAVIENSTDAIALITPMGKVLYASPSTYKIIGYTPEEFIHSNGFNLIWKEDRKEVFQALVKILLHKGSNARVECRLVRKDKSIIWVECTGTNLLYDKHVHAIVANYRDITDRKRAEERQQTLSNISKLLVSSIDHRITLKEIAKHLVPSLGDYCRIILLDRKGKIKDTIVHHINPQGIELVEKLYDSYKDDSNSAYGVLHILKTGISEMITNVNDPVFIKKAKKKGIQSLVESIGIQSYIGVPLIVHERVVGVMVITSIQDVRTYSKDDLSFLEEVARRIVLKLDNTQLYIDAQKEINERKKAEGMIKKLAYFDPLTKLPNRLLLYRYIERAIQKSEQKFAILFLDLNRFKNINDTLGHDVGDVILVTIAKRFKTLVKGKGIVSRLGGDEFTFFLNPIHKKIELTSFIKEVENSLKNPITIDNHSFHLTASIGVSIFPDNGMDRHSLLKCADVSMYYAKNTLKRGYSFYHKNMNKKVVERTEMEEQLRLALENHEFELYYQPIVDLQTKKIISAEALIRWNHPQKGVLLPSSFLEIAGEVNLLSEIELWVFNQVYYQKKLWEKETGEDMLVSINVSSNLFKEKSFMFGIKNLIKQFPHNAIGIEIRENSLMRDTYENLRVLKDLKSLKTSLIIDDFGTGYSSLSYLNLFPIDTLKIDASFIHNIARHEKDRLVTKAIISLAKNLQMKIIAEGVETNEQYNFLKEHDCDEVQGYLLSKPLPASDYIRFFLKREKIYIEKTYSNLNKSYI